MFGDFDGIEHDTIGEAGILFLASILVPLLMLNLLIAIISEAHAEVVENKIKGDYAKKCTIILELEAYVVWNRNKN
jgi:uncharacterized paraquat-inducible protein A